jgi:hypothetical protein
MPTEAALESYVPQEDKGFDEPEDSPAWHLAEQLFQRSETHSPSQYRRPDSLSETSALIPPTMNNDTDDPMSSEDWNCLQKFVSTQLSVPLGEQSRRSVLVGRVVTWRQLTKAKSIVTPFFWPEFRFSSMPFRFAALAFASHLVRQHSDEQSMRYISKFYEYAQKAIDALAFLEIVAATYTILLHTYATCESFDTALVHFKGLCTALILSQNQVLSNTDRRFIENLWQASLQILWRAFWATNEATLVVCDRELQLLVDLHTILQNTSFMLYTGYDSGLPLGFELWCDQLNTLECYLVFYLDSYLALRNRLGVEDKINEKALIFIETSIRDVLQKITLLVPQQPIARALILRAGKTIELQSSDCISDDITLPLQRNQMDVKAAFLFGWAKVVETAITCPADRMSNTASVYSSLVLFRLCQIAYPERRALSGCSMTRSLFWTGLGLTKHVSAPG